MRHRYENGGQASGCKRTVGLGKSRSLAGLRDTPVQVDPSDFGKYGLASWNDVMNLMGLSRLYQQYVCTCHVTADLRSICSRRSPGASCRCQWDPVTHSSWHH